ncbi:MAG: hypothetical protein HYY04_05620 [Chloroflexi bacterium]|nr:hypothetical protein [Chloroflexota bacterium]
MKRRVRLLFVGLALSALLLMTGGSPVAARGSFCCLEYVSSDTTLSTDSVALSTPGSKAAHRR